MEMLGEDVSLLTPVRFFDQRNDLDMRLGWVCGLSQYYSFCMPCRQTSLDKSKNDFETAQLEWKDSQNQLSQQMVALQEVKESLEAQVSQLSNQLDEAQCHMEQQVKSTMQGAEKVSFCGKEVNQLCLHSGCCQHTFIIGCIQNQH